MNRQFNLFSLWTVQALAVLGWLIVAERGFSSSRLVVLGIALALVVFSAALAFFSRRAVFTLRPWQRESLLLVSVSVVLLAPAAILILRALGETSGFVYTLSAERLTPLACWLTVSALELVALLVWQKRAEMAAPLQPIRKMLRVALICLLVAALLGFFASLLPAAHKDGSWGGPATPLLEWQILLALLAALLALLSPDLSIRWRGVSRPVEPLIPILIYLFTCLLWLSQPIIPGFFATPPRAPNFEIYPFSDALIYAQYAQSALVGHGFLWPDVPARPLYIAFLTWLHALAGQDYTHVIVLQTLVLAAFPAVLYMIGKELGGRPLGLGFAILAALRDLTANVAAPFALNYTYSKLFFSEIPAALLISLFTLFSLRWLRTSHSAPRTLFLGGILGLAALVRLQSVVLLLAVLPIGFFVIKNRRSWALGSALMVLGVALTIAPWLIRNAVATGGLVLDNPISQTMTLARRWSGDNGNDLIPQLPNEGLAQYSSRMSALALESLRQRPTQILSAAIGHFVNSETDNLLLFPARDQLNSPAELLWPQHAFWQGNTPAPFVIVYLCLFCLGLAAAWHKNGLVGLLPLVISLIYNAWTALFLSSGDRFLVPVDWAVYLYLFFGLLTLVSLIFAGREHVSAWIAARDNGEPADGDAGPVSVRRLLLTAAFILLLGASLPLTEFAFPKIAPLKAAAPLPGESVFSGRAVYPRFYKANQGEPGSAKLGYGKSAQARLVFYLVGEQSGLVIFPINTSPGFFPNAANVTIYGTQQDGFMQAERITVEQNGKTAQYP
jgi:hypothetical protein